MKNELIHPENGNELGTTTVSDKPNTGEKAEQISKKIVLTTTDLNSKDAGKWLTARKHAINVYYPNLSRLFDFYDYVLGIDSTLSGLVKKRQTAVLNKQLLYKNGDEQVEAMDEFIRSGKFKALLRQFLWDRQYGRGAVEFKPGQEFNWVPIPRKHVKTKWQVISKSQEGIDGYDYTKYKNVFVVDNNDLGDLLSCSLAAAYKKDAIGDWAELIEIWGEPTQVIYYQAFNPQVLEELDAVLEKAGSSRRIKLPEGAKYEHHENKGGNSTGDLQMQFIDLMNKEMAIAQVGGTETTGTSKGSGHAQSEVHYKVQLEVIKEDMDYLVDLLNDPQLHKIFKSYGIPVTEGGYWEFDSEIDIDYITKQKEVIKTALEMNLPISTKHIYDTLAIPEPSATDTLISPKPAQKPEEENEDDLPAKAPKKKKGKKITELDNLHDSWIKKQWIRFRNSLADFFEKAP